MKIKYSSTFVVSVITLLTSSSIKECFSCVVSQSERVVTVGDTVFFSCNARPNNEMQSSIINVKMGRSDDSGIVIYRPPVYGRGGGTITEELIADGYFLSYLDDKFTKITIKINETQLKHGGEYFCNCATGLTTPVGTGYLAVLEPKLVFVREKETRIAPGATVGLLNCSISFNGSVPSASIDLTVLDANGTQLSTRSNLLFARNITSYHVIYKVTNDRDQDQSFTCEMKVFNHSSAGKTLLISKNSTLDFNWRQKSTPASSENTTLFKASTTISIVVVVAVTVLILIIIALIIVCKKKFHQRMKVESSTIKPYKQNRSVRPSIEYPTIKATSEDKTTTEEKKQQQSKTPEAGEVFVVDNAIYDVGGQTSNIDPADGFKAEQIYSEVQK